MQGNIYLLDILGTMCDLAGVKTPNTVEGSSFRPVLEGRSKTVRDILYGAYCGGSKPGMRSVRKGDWKLLDHKGSGGSNYERDGEWGLKQYAIADTDPNAPGQLYNLASDPGETINVYSKHPEIVSELKALLEEAKTSGRTAPKR